MKGTQTVIAERAISSTSLMEDSHYLSVLCSHLVCHNLLPDTHEVAKLG